MNTTLLRFIGGMAMLSIAFTTNAQVPGNPQQPNITTLQKLPAKSSQKLSADLQRLSERAKMGNIDLFAKPGTGNIPNGRERFMQVFDGKVIIDVTVFGDAQAAKAQIEKAGGKVTAIYGRLISAVMPVASLSQLENASQVKFARPAYTPMHSGNNENKIRQQKQLFQPAPMPTVYSQGDTAQGSNLARKKYKSDGKGVKVGLLSDTYDSEGGAAASILSDELPGKGNPKNFKKEVEVLSEYEYPGSDEGRAMAEIVHDVAPGAEILFHTAYNGLADFAQGIIRLAEAGCKVIADDVYYLDEPFFQDGLIAQAIDKVNKKGITYFSAAGNFGNRSYEYKYQPTNYELFGPGNGTAHNFAAPGATPLYFQPVTIASRGWGTFVFQWDDPSFSSSGVAPSSDLDIFLLNNLGEIVAASFESNPDTGEPLEIIDYFNPSQTSTTFYVYISKYSGPDPTRLKYLLFSNGFFNNNVPVPGQFASAIVGHANAAGAIATGAASYRNTPAFGITPPLAETFSSLGGTAILFDKEGNRMAPVVRKKPEITAPDGGNNSFFATDDPFDTDTFPNFYGTSAAAPHAAGVAALMIDAQKLNTITPDQIKGILGSATYDMDNRYTPGFDKGFDYNTGTGLIRAELAVGEVKFPNLYVKNLELVPLCSENPGSVRNWKVVNPNPFEVKAHWFLTGFSQDARPVLSPGDNYFSTKTAYYRNFPVPNIVILDWEDNFGFNRFDIASSSTKECKNQVATLETSPSQDKAALLRETAVKPEIVEVFPNPSTVKFRLYLSLAKNEKTEISLYSSDGRQLYQNNVAGNGIHEIDATRYKAGVYLMKVKQGSFHKTIKVIKQ